MVACVDPALVQDGVEQPADRRALPPLVARPHRFALCLNHLGQAIEKLPRARPERRLELVKRAPHILHKRSRRKTFDERAAEVQRGQLGQRERGLVQAPKRSRLELPDLRALARLVVEREPRILQRVEVSPDRAGGHAGRRRQVPDRGATGGLNLAQDAPLSDHLGVTRHGGGGTSNRGLPVPIIEGPRRV